MYANTTSARIGSGFLRSVHISRKNDATLLVGVHCALDTCHI